MTSHEYKQNAYYLLYLIRCVLHEQAPAKEKLGKMDLSGVFAVAKAHSLTAMAAYALESAGVVEHDFKQERMKAIRKNVSFDFERQAVLAEFESAGIWYCPLKGCIIKDWYPEIGMREMADNDILVDGSKMSEVREIMERLEFETKVFGKSHQDVYEKEPVYNFEIHSTLLEPKHGDTLYNYYKNIKPKLIKDEDSNYGYHFSDEDFYIYFVAHEYKHFMEAGTGLRSLVDTFVIGKHFGDSLDKEYISRELRRLGMYEYETENRALVEKLFDGEELSEREKKLLEIYITSGTYGSFQVRMSQQGLDGSTRSTVKYVLERLSLPEQELKEFHPFFYRHKALRPILYTKRLIAKSLDGTGALKRELKVLGNVTKKKNRSPKTLLRAAVNKITASPFGRVAKILYDAFIITEYHIFSLIWQAKSDKLTKEQRDYVAKNVTFIYKSFERQYMARRLFWNIQKFFPGVKVIIADDSSTPLKIKSRYAKVIQLPFNSGLSYGINRALAEVSTPYTFRMDDDELLTPLSKIYEQLRFLEAHPEVDLVGIQACSAPFYEQPENRAKQYYRFDMKNAPKPLKIPHMTRIDPTHLVVGKTPNVFLARTEKYRQVGYDDNIRMIDHHEFFTRAAGELVSAMDTSAFVFHYHNWFDRNYMKYRNDVAADARYIREKHGVQYYK